MTPQCWFCVYWLFFKPLPDETFSCCAAFGETPVADIDLAKGNSPKVARYFDGQEKCPRFKKGESICEIDSKDVFKRHLVRQQGEDALFKIMSQKI